MVMELPKLKLSNDARLTVTYPYCVVALFLQLLAKGSICWMVQNSSAVWFLACLQDTVVTVSWIETLPVSLQIIQTYPADPSCGPREAGGAGGAIVLLTVLLTKKHMDEILTYFGHQGGLRDPPPSKRRLFLMVVDWEIATSEPQP